MSLFIREISVRNFKSLKNCSVSNCNRINLFIGRPNVGKSNILEALSLFSIPYLRENSAKKLSSLLRLENEPELFYNGDTSQEASVTTNLSKCSLNFTPKEGLKAEIDFYDHSFENIRIDDKLYVTGIRKFDTFEPPIKRYNFRTDVKYKKGHAKYLMPPYGFNLLSIIENYPELKNQVVSLFREYGLELALDKASQTIRVVQSDKDGLFLIPYNSIADTLQRVIFFKAAIASNNNSVLLFEEPEAHSFPPYMTHITQEMIYKNDNQYFIATHSPFILNDLLENCRKELSVFIVHYQNYETQVKQLSEKELHDVFQNGVDLFTNSESFV